MSDSREPAGLGKSGTQSLPLLKSERIWGPTDFSAVNIGLAIATWAFLIGGTTALMVGAKQGIAAIIIGNVVGVSLMALAACIPTAKYGVDQVTAGRTVFGEMGMRLIAVLIVLIVLGWTGVLSIMFARATANVLQSMNGSIVIDPNGPAITGLALFSLLVIWLLLRRGARSIRGLNKVMAPALVVITAGMLYMVLTQNSFGEIVEFPAIAPLVDEHANFMLAVEFNMAAGLGWWPIVGSLARYTRTQRTALYSNFAGLFAAAVLGETVGLLAALSLGHDDPTEWMLPLGGPWLGVVTLAFIAVANLTSLVSMIFSACESLRWVTPHARRVPWNLLTGVFLVAGGVLAFWPATLYDRFFTFLTLTALVLAPIVGIVVVDFFLLRRGRLRLQDLYRHGSDSAYHFWAGVNPSALISLAAGIATYWVLLPDPINLVYSGWFRWIGASLPSLVVAAVCHWVLTKLFIAGRRGGYAPPTAPRIVDALSVEPGGARNQGEAPLLVIQNDECCPPGLLADWIGEAGGTCDVRQGYRGDRLPENLTEYSGVIVLGGSGSVTEDRQWFVSVRGLIRQALEDERPLLGVGLGHHLCASTVGATIGPNPAGHLVGVRAVQPTPAVQHDPLLNALPLDAYGVQWNRDVVTSTPPGTEVLARASDWSIQSIRFGPSAWGLQVHPEADPSLVDGWAETLRDDGSVGRADLDLLTGDARGYRHQLEAFWRPVVTRFACLTENARR